MVIDPSGRLIEADDGGIYRLNNPSGIGGARFWESLIGDLQITEVGDLAYDPINQIVTVGTQDTGNQEQSAANSLQWTSVSLGDGNTQAVGVEGAQVWRYAVGNNFGTLVRRTFDSQNVQLPLTTAITGIKAIDQPNAFVESPLVTNAVDPSRLLLGFNALYRTRLTAVGNVLRDQVVEIQDTGAAVNAALAAGRQITALAYGGRNADGSANAGIIYRARGGEIRVSEDNGAHWHQAVTLSGGGSVSQITLDPTNWRVAYAVAGSSVWVTANGGTTWEEITGVGAGFGALPGGAINSVAIVPIDGPDMHFALRDGSTFDVSLRGARTMGDVEHFIEVQSRAAGSTVARVAVTLDLPSQRLVLTDQTAGGNTFGVTALNGSTVAAQLGIASNAAAATLNGGNFGAPFTAATTLDQVRNATGPQGITRTFASGRPQDILLVAGQRGVFRAFNPVGDPSQPGLYGTLQPAGQVDVRFAGADNDIQFSAKQAGTDLRTLQVSVRTRTGGTDSVTYNAVTNTLEFRIPNTGRTANQLITLVQNTPAVSALFDVFSIDSGTGNIRPTTAHAITLLRAGQEAHVQVTLAGANNDLSLAVRQPGVDIQGIQVQFIDRLGVGSDRVVWNPFTKVLEFHVAAATTAAQTRALLNTQAGVDDATLAARRVFRATVTDQDQSSPANAGTGTVIGQAVTVSTSLPSLRWTEFGANLPNAVITDLEYIAPLPNGSGGTRPGTDILLIGSRGRGVWKLENARAELAVRSELEVAGDASANQFIVRLVPGRPEGLTQFVEVLRDGTRVGDEVPLSALERIIINGLGGNDIVQIDSRIRLPNGIFVDGGAGNDSIVLLGQPGDALIDLTPGLTGSAMVGGATGGVNGFLRINFQNTEVVDANPPGADALRTIRSGLDLVSNYAGFSTALANQLASLPAVGSALTRALQGAAFTPLAPLADRGGLIVGKPRGRGG